VESDLGQRSLALGRNSYHRRRRLLSYMSARSNLYLEISPFNNAAVATVTKGVKEEII